MAEGTGKCYKFVFVFVCVFVFVFCLLFFVLVVMFVLCLPLLSLLLFSSILVSFFDLRGSILEPFWRPWGTKIGKNAIQKQCQTNGRKKVTRVCTGRYKTVQASRGMGAGSPIADLHSQTSEGRSARIEGLKA